MPPCCGVGVVPEFKPLLPQALGFRFPDEVAMIGLSDSSQRGEK